MLTAVSTLLIAGAVGLGSWSCSGKSCTDMGCLEAVSVRVSGGMGPSYVSGTVTLVDATVLEFDCAGGSPGDDRLHCTDDGFTVFGAAMDDTLTLDISDGSGAAFEGTVTPTREIEKNFNGPGCGTCASGEVAVELSP